MKNIDQVELAHYCSIEKDEMNNLMNNINTQIDGRVCATDYMYYWISLFKLVKDDVKVYAEIGTLWGGSVGMILKLVNPDTEIFCIDLFNGYYNKPTVSNDWNKCSISINGNNHLEFVKTNLNKLNDNNNKINYLKGSSYDNETVSTFKSYDKKVDFFFIDGDHSEKGVVSDFLMYKDVINNHGIICFDNYGGPVWPGVKKGLDKLNFVEHGFRKIGNFMGKNEGVLIIQRIN
tara:strand:- start:229 stop:927 length:699 start_codon:yes stop_codon:yes gene_type:complete